MEHKFPLGRSNRENGTTFWAVPLFLGIFQSGEPKKRFPFSPEPEFSEFLTKWKAPRESGLTAYVLYYNGQQRQDTTLQEGNLYTQVVTLHFQHTDTKTVTR